MATIRKRGDLQWQAIVKRKGFTPISKTFLSRKDAEAWATVTESEMLRGVFISRTEAEKTTLREALDRYERGVTVRKKGGNRECVRIRRWREHKLADMALASLRGKDFAMFRDQWRKAGKAENTIRLELALLSHLFEVARREWGMESLQNPIKSIALPGPSATRERRLLPGEEQALLDELAACRNGYAAPAVRFALSTVMRQSEILQLRWEDVDLRKRVALLHDTKNGEARAVPLSTEAVTVLEGLVRPIKGGRIFLITQDGLIRTFKRACERGQAKHHAESGDHEAGFLKNLRFHDLRHEATSRLFERGDFSLMEVASITGHKTLSMLKRYTHLKAEDLARKLG